ncbi:MAG: orotate phosphoribosyltransferase [Polyangiales bacterium]
MDLLAMLREHSYRKGTFQLASGRTSDFFIDCKTTVLRAQGHVLAGRALLEAIHAIEVEVVAVAGVALGGCPLASAVAYCSAVEGAPIDAVYVRKTAKEHGTARSIEGAAHLPEGAVMVLVEDTVTTGGSSLRAVEALQKAGFRVAAVLALVDREEGAKEAFEAAGVPFRALYTRSEF